MKIIKLELTPDETITLRAALECYMGKTTNQKGKARAAEIMRKSRLCDTFDLSQAIDKVRRS